MRNRGLAILGLMVGLLMLGAPLLAHHGGSEYDMQHQVTAKASVTTFYWANPHCYIYVDVKDSDGKDAKWGLEMSSPASMKRGGWTSQSLHVGDEITVTFAPSKKGTQIGHVEKVVLADGKVLGAGVRE